MADIFQRSEKIWTQSSSQSITQTSKVAGNFNKDVLKFEQNLIKKVFFGQ